MIVGNILVIFVAVLTLSSCVSGNNDNYKVTNAILPLYITGTLPRASEHEIHPDARPDKERYKEEDRRKAQEHLNEPAQHFINFNPSKKPALDITKQIVSDVPSYLLRRHTELGGAITFAAPDKFIVENQYALNDVTDNKKLLIKVTNEYKQDDNKQRLVYKALLNNLLRLEYEKYKDNFPLRKQFILAKYSSFVRAVIKDDKNPENRNRAKNLLFAKTSPLYSLKEENEITEQVVINNYSDIQQSIALAFSHHKEMNSSLGTNTSVLQRYAKNTNDYITREYFEVNSSIRRDANGFPEIQQQILIPINTISSNLAEKSYNYDEHWTVREVVLDLTKPVNDPLYEFTTATETTAEKEIIKINKFYGSGFATYKKANIAGSNKYFIIMPKLPGVAFDIAIQDYRDLYKEAITQGTQQAIVNLFSDYRILEDRMAEVLQFDPISKQIYPTNFQLVEENSPELPVALYSNRMSELFQDYANDLCAKSIVKGSCASVMRPPRNILKSDYASAANIIGQGQHGKFYLLNETWGVKVYNSANASSQAINNVKIFNHYYGEGTAFVRAGVINKVGCRLKVIPGKSLGSIDDETLIQQIWQKKSDAINELTAKLKEKGILHYDIANIDNILYDAKTGKFNPIDFDQASIHKSVNGNFVTLNDYDTALNRAKIAIAFQEFGEKHRLH